MNATVDVDMTGFEAAVREYSRVTGRSGEESAARGLKNWCIHAIRACDVAERAAIRRLVAFAPLVAWKLRKVREAQGVVGRWTGKRWAPGNARTFDIMGRVSRSKKTGRVSDRRRIVRRRGAFYTRVEAKAFARQHFYRRLAAVGFVRGFLGALANALGGSGGKTFAGVKAISEAGRGPESYSVSATMFYDYRRSKTYGEQPTMSAKAERRAIRALQRTLVATIADIETYTARKLQEHYDRIAGRALAS